MASEMSVYDGSGAEKFTLNASRKQKEGKQEAPGKRWPKNMLQ